MGLAFPDVRVYVFDMGLLEKIFKKPKTIVAPGFQTFTDNNPIVTTWDKKIYEQELTRAAIERFATACSKLKPEVVGNVSSSISKFIHSRPNDTMTWPAFLKRLAALYDADGTAVVVPVFARDGMTITGLYPLRFETAEVLDVNGTPWIEFYFAASEPSAIELSNVCIINKFQIDSDIFGERNCIDSTMNLLYAQTEAQLNAIKTGAKIRFIGAVNGMSNRDILKEKRKQFIEDNFQGQYAGGIMLYDNTFFDVKQVEPQRYTIEDTEMQRIQNNVCNYFGINEDILQNKADENVYGAWYEGKVEPFAVALGEGLTNVLFSQVEQEHGKRITFSSNRLEYASNASKRNMVRDMFDRGIMSINEAREVLQLPPVEGGDVRAIRGEYVNAQAISTLTVGGVGGTGKGNGRAPKNVNESDFDLEGKDVFYNDSDGYGKLDVDEGV